MYYLSVCISGFQLKFSDGLPYSFLDPHPRNLEQRQGVVHWLDGNVERLGNLETTYRRQYESNFFLWVCFIFSNFLNSISSISLKITWKYHMELKIGLFFKACENVLETGGFHKTAMIFYVIFNVFQWVQWCICNCFYIACPGGNLTNGTTHLQWRQNPNSTNCT